MGDCIAPSKRLGFEVEIVVEVHANLGRRVVLENEISSTGTDEGFGGDWTDRLHCFAASSFWARGTWTTIALLHFTGSQGGGLVEDLVSCEDFRGIVVLHWGGRRDRGGTGGPALTMETFPHSQRSGVIGIFYPRGSPPLLSRIEPPVA